MAPKNILEIGNLEKLSPTERINAYLSIRNPDDQRFTSNFLENQCKLRSVEVPSPKTAKAVFAFKVDRSLCNASGNLHGGAQATIFDVCTSLAAQAIGRTGFWLNAGVSRVLTVNYLRPAPEGEDLLLECEVVQLGKTLALLKGTLRREHDGAIVSTCDHNKAAVASKVGWDKDAKPKL
nr:isoform 2 of acyl-coenzyme a thioesterase 13 [Quercus suber]